MPIFVDPSLALEQLKEDFTSGINAIQKEFSLKDLSHNNYRDYFNYGWQMSEGSDEEKEQGVQITKFFDTYQNSFESVNR